MSINCNNGIVIPDLIVDICNGETKNSDCIIFNNAITYLGLTPNSNLTQVVSALLLSLKDARDRIELLEAIATDHETRITTLEP